MKKIKKFFLQILIIALFCILYTPSISHAKIKLNKKNVTLYLNHNTKLKIKNAKSKIKWSSINKKIVTVSNNGKITAIKSGKTKIIAKVKNKKFICNVNVPKQYINYKLLNLKVNDKIHMELMGTAPDDEVSWSSGNENIASISLADGLLMAKYPGKTTIYATINNGFYKLYKCTVNVNGNTIVNPTQKPQATPIPTDVSNNIPETVTTVPIQTNKPTIVPPIAPVFIPTVVPTIVPTIAPTVPPTIPPTVAPTIAPTVAPTVVPTLPSTLPPTIPPTLPPTIAPTVAPTLPPTIPPTVAPTLPPTIPPTIPPTVAPTIAPTVVPETDIVKQNIQKIVNYINKNGIIKSNEKKVYDLTKYGYITTSYGDDTLKFYSCANGKIGNTKYKADVYFILNYPNTETEVYYDIMIGNNNFIGSANIDLSVYVKGDTLMFSGSQPGKANSQFIDGFDFWNEILLDTFEMSYEDIGFESYNTIFSYGLLNTISKDDINNNIKKLYNYIINNGTEISDYIIGDKYQIPGVKYINKNINGVTVYISIYGDKDIISVSYKIDDYSGNSSYISVDLNFPNTIVEFENVVDYKHYNQKVNLNIATYRKWTGLSSVSVSYEDEEVSFEIGNYHLKRLLEDLEIILNEDFNMSMSDIGFIYYNNNWKNSNIK